ncbi:MAG: hypothetical protein GY861_27540 [bacterium]|nr:hypothetical protein [bacterium]
MNLIREHRRLPMQIDGENYSVVVHAILGYVASESPNPESVGSCDKLRTVLNRDLSIAHKNLKVPDSIQLLPYAVILGKDDKQKVIPMGIEKTAYDTRLETIGKRTDMYNNLGFVHAVTLNEFNPENSGILVDGKLQGKLSLTEPNKVKFEGPRPKGLEYMIFNLPVENFGLEAHNEAYLSFYNNGSWEEGRESIDDQVITSIIDSQPRTIVTLGPPDNIPEILNVE